MNYMNSCPLCNRTLAEKPSKHHLIPRTFKGRDIVLLHRVCHRQIHATFTERELLNYYHTIERILENENLLHGLRTNRRIFMSELEIRPGKGKKVKMRGAPGGQYPPPYDLSDAARDK